MAVEAAVAETRIAFEHALVSVFEVAFRYTDPARFAEIPAKVAVPAEAATERVPPRVAYKFGVVGMALEHALSEKAARVTEAVEDTVFPEASWIMTEGWDDKLDPAVLVEDG